MTVIAAIIVAIIMLTRIICVSGKGLKERAPIISVKGVDLKQPAYRDWKSLQRQSRIGLKCHEKEMDHD